VTVNAAYLQDCEDEEVARFENFDTQSTFKHTQRLRPHITQDVSAEELSIMDKAVLHARTLTGRKDTDVSWSKRSALMQRAEYSDAITKLDVMKPVVLTAYARGHSAVHGTYDSLAPFLSAILTMHVPLDENRREELVLALYEVNFVLSVMCLFLNTMFHLDLDSAISDAGN
jgi:hypothetical protein